MSKERLSISELLERATKKREEFIALAIKESIFVESLPANDRYGNESRTRRPIILLDTPAKSKGWARKILFLNQALDELHAADPERFPLTCHLLKTRPQLIKNIASCKIKQKAGVDSKLIKASSVMQRLRLARDKILKCDASELVIDKNIQLKIINDAIDIFAKRPNDNIRSRVHGYVDVVAHLEYRDLRSNKSTMDRKRVTEMGLFILPKRGVDFKFIQPEILENPNGAIYNRVTAISMPLAINEKLYWDSEVQKAKGDKDGAKLAEHLPILNPPAI